MHLRLREIRDGGPPSVNRRSGLVARRLFGNNVQVPYIYGSRGAFSVFHAFASGIRHVLLNAGVGHPRIPSATRGSFLTGSLSKHLGKVIQIHHNVSSE